jgi:hypothetical protein
MAKVYQGSGGAPGGGFPGGAPGGDEEDFGHEEL